MRKVYTIMFSIFCVFGVISSAEAGCYSDRDCGGAACHNNVCATEPGGKCYSDRDCGGAACHNNKCANAPDGKCYSDRDCGGSSCHNNKCAR